MRFNLTAKLAVAAMGLAAICAAPMAQAHENVFYSVNAAVAPGVNVGITNTPVYAQPQPQPVYVQPQPVYAAPAPVYVQSAPVYVQGPAYGARYVQPAWRDGHGERERMDRAHWQEARWHGDRGELGGNHGEARGHGGHRD